jgi:anti-sigma factor RsiW
MSIDCLRAREELWPPERPRLHESDVEEARAHVDTCRSCRLYFEQDRALLDLYSRMRHEPAPREVREGVFDALARARLVREQKEVQRKDPVRGRRAMIVGAAALAASLALFAPAAFDRPEAASVDDPGLFAEDYLRRAVREDHIVSSDPREVSRFVQRELGVNLDPLQLAGLELESAEVCLIRGRRGAMIVYKSPDGPVSHYLIPFEGAGTRAPAVAAYGDGGQTDPMPVVTWSTPQLEQALVGEIEEEELLRIASLAAS